MQYDVETILIRCPNWVGDAVMATPVLDCIRDNFPQARITGIIGKNAQGIVRDGPWFDDFIDCEDKTLGGMRRMIKKIHALKPDMGILLTNSFRSVLPVWLGKAKYIYGYRRDFRGMFLSGGPKPLRNGFKITPLPMQEYYLEICRWLNLKLPPVIKPSLFISDELQKRGDDILRKYGIQAQDKIIGFNIGASFGSSKCWPPEHFAAAAELFTEKKGVKILLLAGPGEDKIVQAILAKTKAPIINTACDHINLELLKPLVKRCDLFITNDTGPRQYAVALDVPVVVIMGPTNPRYTSVNLEKTIVIRTEAECSPCHKKTCPTDHRCMRQITPQMVFEAGEKLLNE
ncbi:MAG: lipopolysaccharide heptosyltransferase II [Planctomycetota bacterium]|jgi:heptosyltransferase-2